MKSKEDGMMGGEEGGDTESKQQTDDEYVPTYEMVQQVNNLVPLVGFVII